MKKLFIAFVLLCMTAILLAACGGSSSSSTGTGPSSTGTASSSGTTSSSSTVHMGQTNFEQSSVTISKGGTLTLVNDTSSVHIIANGQWVNNAPQPKQEPGAPTVSNIQFSTSGQSQTIGPFNTAGTFHLYCTVHPGMNLTVIVQ